MGLYDHVDYECKCPTCNKLLTDWQTKDGNSCLNTVDFLGIRRFYALCDTCKTWVEFIRKPATSIADFDMVIKMKDES